MAETLRHITLNEAAAFKRRRREIRRPPPYDKVERDYDEFRRAAAQKLRELDDNRRVDAERFARYGYAPAPIFCLGLTQRVPYAGFKDKLKSVNIETISSATETSD